LILDVELFFSYQAYGTIGFEESAAFLQSSIWMLSGVSFSLIISPKKKFHIAASSNTEIPTSFIFFVVLLAAVIQVLKNSN